MARFLVRKRAKGPEDGAMIVGSYPVSTDKAACNACASEEQALDFMAQDSHEWAKTAKGFQEFLTANGLTRDDFSVEKVEG